MHLKLGLPYRPPTGDRRWRLQPLDRHDRTGCLPGNNKCGRSRETHTSTTLHIRRKLTLHFLCTFSALCLHDGVTSIHRALLTLSPVYSMAFGISFIACLTPKSARISSVPPRIASNLYVRWNSSTTLPIPPCVRPLPPKMLTASSATS